MHIGLCLHREANFSFVKNLTDSTKLQTNRTRNITPNQPTNTIARKQSFSTRLFSSLIVSSFTWLNGATIHSFFITALDVG
jgi:hypothetical protein